MTTEPRPDLLGALPDGLLDVDDARARILALATPVGTERAPLTTLAMDGVDRVLGATTSSLRALPPFDNSAMDGYGVRAADVATVGTQLRIAGASLAGHGTALTVGVGECVSITTGAMIPAGVDAVVMREQCDETRIAASSGAVVVVNHAPRAGEHIRRRGDDVDTGAVVGAPGDLITPARLNLLLSAGHTNAVVYRRPTVGVLASGDELEDIGDGGFGRGDRIADDVIVNSNAWAIGQAALRAGASVRMLGIAKDTLDDHVAKMDVDDIDLLITIGGVSMGSHDHVRPALLQLGATLHLWKVAMRPGKPLAFGTLPRDDKGRRRPMLVLGLPGNPVSSLVTFTLFGVPLLRALQGRKDTTPSYTRAVLADDRAFTKKKGLAFFARAVVEHDQVRTLERQGSGQISGLAAANALACFAKDDERIDVGSIVRIIAL